MFKSVPNSKFLLDFLAACSLSFVQASIQLNLVITLARSRILMGGYSKESELPFPLKTSLDTYLVAYFLQGFFD